MTLVLDIPFPPTANRLTRNFRGRMVTNPEYTEWRKKTDAWVRYHYRGWPTGRVTANFKADITLDETERSRAGDLDNRIKPIFDWLQAREFIRNDRDLDELHARWGTAPHGCRVVLVGT